MTSAAGLASPLRSPDQPAKAHPGDGVAWSVTVLPSRKDPPGGATAPSPVTATDRGNAPGANAAATCARWARPCRRLRVKVTLPGAGTATAPPAAETFRPWTA